MALFDHSELLRKRFYNMSAQGMLDCTSCSKHINDFQKVGTPTCCRYYFKCPDCTQDFYKADKYKLKRCEYCSSTKIKIAVEDAEDFVAVRLSKNIYSTPPKANKNKRIASKLVKHVDKKNVKTADKVSEEVNAKFAIDAIYSDLITVLDENLMHIVETNDELMQVLENETRVKDSNLLEPIDLDTAYLEDVWLCHADKY